MFLLGEVGDLCAQAPSAFFKPSGYSHTVQRTWNNNATATGADPCQPALPGEVYFNAVPVLNDVVNFNFQGQSGQTKGVSIPIGQSKTIDVDLFTEAAMGAFN